MSRESKILNKEDCFWNQQDTVKHYESFGWELLSLSDGQITMSRETQNPVYPELVKSEANYEECVGKIRELEDSIVLVDHINGKLAFFLLILGIAPGVLYLVFKSKKIKEQKAFNEDTNKEIARLTQEANKICADSRVVFFSKQ